MGGGECHSLSGVASDRSVALAPANNLLPMLLQVTATKASGSHIKRRHESGMGGLGKEGFSGRGTKMRAGNGGHDITKIHYIHVLSKNKILKF